MNGMFNWEPSEGQSLASPYLYVFFVVTIPLTVFVYIGWQVETHSFNPRTDC